ncbi:MAG: NADH-quinone oxidoreductase subunit L [Euryarchaeota archaeon]|nr:NADH-quinone oxidoreductase subunit L [Euryarchaeota archaeon]
MMFIEYTWLVPLIPAICFLIVGFFGNMFDKRHGGGFLAIAGVAVSCVLSVLISAEFFMSSAYVDVGYVAKSFTWFAFPGGFDINIGYYVDTLSCLMMMFASFISMLILIYSLGYMSEEGKRKQRYFAEVALFVTGMLGLAVSNNFLMMFIFWEVMGLCSYLLIGFWSFSHPEGDDASDNAASAAKKAFLVTRLGDVSLMAGLFILLFAFKSLDYTVVFDAASIAAVDHNLIVLASLLIFGGAIGKSAQFPLLDWLPDAMAGPTTVSALIHAATMVKAGVYLVARCFPIFTEASGVMLFVAVIGGFTAFFAATMAMNNMNIKKVLAYSTLSQLGYMFLALGAGGYMIAIGMESGNTALIAAGSVGYVAGCLHMVNHAFFKALLFLGSGSVIHSTGTEDMREMGGLESKMKVTSITMLIGSLSIAGFPFFAGFWSKDLILEQVLHAGDYGAAGWVFIVLWLLAVVTAFMTAFYMFRMWYMTFRGPMHKKSEHSHGESPRSMTIPLMVLSVFAFGFGFVLFFGFDSLLSIQIIGGQFRMGGMESGGAHYLVEFFTNVWTYVTIALVLLAIYLAKNMYELGKIDPARFNGDGESWLYKALTERWWFPQLYDQLSWKLGYGVARGVEFIDSNIIDGSVNGLSNAVAGSGELVSKAQTGDVNNYASAVIGGLIVLFVAVVALFVFMGGL